MSNCTAAYEVHSESVPLRIKMRLGTSIAPSKPGGVRIRDRNPVAPDRDHRNTGNWLGVGRRPPVVPPFRCRHFGASVQIVNYRNYRTEQFNCGCP